MNVSRFKGNSKPVNIKARANYPGETEGIPLSRVRSSYENCNKIYSQTENLAVGTNNDIVINLPASARYLVGISYYSPFENSVESPLFSYELNNSIIIQKTPVRILLPSNLESQVFYPIDLPLSGQDTHLIDVTNVTQVKNATFVFHYI